MASPRFFVTTAALDPAALQRWVQDPAHGAVIGFQGVVRRDSKSGPVSALDYSAYESMALAKLEAIAAEMETLYGPLKIAAHHRIGRLPVGTVSFALAVGAPHREQAFQAAARFVDRLKEIVPIWKQDLSDQEVS